MEEKIITLVTSSFQHAQVLKNILETEGIECFLQNVNVIEGAVNMGVKVRIKESDLEAAIKIIESIEESGIDRFREKKGGRPQKPRILLPVDFSDYSDKAADFALEWAARLNAEITVLNVYFNPIINTLPFSEAYIYDANLDQMLADTEEQAKTDMKEFIARFKERASKAGADLQIKHKLVRGVAEDEIVRFSDEYKPTLIILGTRGKDRKAADLIGSVTAEVMELARVPVLAVPEDFNFQGIDHIKNVLYATNFEESDFVALNKLERIVKPLDVTIHFVHVGPDAGSTWTKVKLEGLRTYTKDRFPNSSIVCDYIESEDFWIGLESYIRKKKIDIISLTARRRNLLTRLFNPSVAKRMLFHTNTPMLVFHQRTIITS